MLLKASFEFLQYRSIVNGKVVQLYTFTTAQYKY